MKYYAEEFWQVVEAFVELPVILLGESLICGRDIRDVELFFVRTEDTAKSQTCITKATTTKKDYVPREGVG